MSTEESEFCQISNDKRLIIDPQSLIKNIPPNLMDFTTIEVEIFSREELNVESCQSVNVGTGIYIEMFVPFTHSVMFHGYSNSLGLQCISRYIFPCGEELKVNIRNYDTNARMVKKGMSLGKIQIKSHENGIHDACEK